MRAIDFKVFSHVHGEREVYGVRDPKNPWMRRGMSHSTERYQSPEWASNTTIRRGFGFEVSSFEELVKLVAGVGYHNRRFNLLFRGQEKDHLDQKDGSKLYSNIYRPKHGQARLLRPVLAERFAELFEAVRRLRLPAFATDVGRGLSRHWEYQAALLQHYGLRKTPFLDVTHSLRVAASFALPRRSGAEGYLFVLGMPHPHGSISHFIDDDIVLVKLQNVCPPEALRPHYQEGYLVGRLSARDRFKEKGDNAAYRLLAKYKLLNDGSFWTKNFQPIPRAALLPKTDPLRAKLVAIVGEDAVP
jgi:hypothetical protein